MKLKIFLLTIFLLMTSIIWSQNYSQDFLNKNDFEELKRLIKESKVDSLKTKYIEHYLKKAKFENNVIEIAEGYKYKSLAHYPDSLSVKYADSIILITKNIKHIKYPALGYNIKGGVFYELGEYKKALDQYLIAIDFAKKNNNRFQYLTLKFNIGLLKNHLGERKEAQKIFKSYLEYIEQTNGKYPKNYIKGLYAIADSYVYSKDLDTADIYINKGIHYALKDNESEYYAYFILTSGINNYFKRNFTIAIDSLKKANRLLKLNDFEETRIATSDYYIGKSFFELNKKNESLIHFKKVDSIIHLTNDVTPELIDSYNYLIDDSKSKKNLKSQVEYINSLIKFDSVLDNNYKYVKNTLVKKYDTPELILEKERLIKKLNNSYSLSKNKIYVLSIIIIILIIILFYSIRKSIINRKKFELIKANLNLDIKEENKEDLIKVTTTTTTTTGLPENLVKEILFSLEKFESSNKFAKKHYTLNILAKELNTNSSYLSKIINATKKVNFANYLNNLKIDLAMKRLAQEKQFRSFTIKAIAEDSGFNNAQSFSVAFHKKTGLYPSYFIKKLNTDK